MSFTRWLRNLKSALASGRVDSTHRRRSLRAAGYRPRLEALEDRTVPSFSPAVLYPVTTLSGVVLAADFNGDGNQDLVSSGNLPGFSTTVSMLLGRGDGSFQAAPDYNLAEFAPYFVPGLVVTGQTAAVGDYSGDGKPDLVVDLHCYDETTEISEYETGLLVGNGDGTFHDGGLIGYFPPVMGDFNGDSIQDGVSVWDRATVQVSVSNVGNIFLVPQNYSGVSTVTVADVNGDGKQDIIAVGAGGWNPDYHNHVSVFLGNGDGSFQASRTSTTLNQGSEHAVAADFNGDGKIDLVTNYYGSQADTPTFGGARILLGNGDGYFQAGASYRAGVFPQHVAVGDFNRDGRPDFVLANHGSGDVSVFLGNGDGTFRADLSYPTGAHINSVVVMDFNRDGFDDIAAGASRVAVLINNGNWPPLAAPTISITDVTVTEGNTGTRTAVFTVLLSAAYNQTIAVAYNTANGTATAGSDYMANSSSLTFTPGQTSKTITVLVNGDRLGEANETFVVNLSTADAIISDGQGAGTIVEDEPRISISDVSKKEGKKNQTTQFTFTVTISAAYDQAVTMSFRTVDGTAKTSDGDYIAQIGTLTFAPGETTETITIEVKGDSKNESNETFYLDLFGNSANALFNKNRGIGTILNDD